MNPKFKQLLTVAALCFSIWTMLAIPSALQVHVNSIANGTPAPLFRALYMTVINYWLYALVTLPAVWLAIRFRFARENWVFPLGVHTGAFFLWSFVYSLLRGFVFPLANQFFGVMGTRSFELAWAVFKGSMYNNLWMYCAVVLATTAISYYRENKERQLQAMQLQAQLSQTQLQLLKGQLHPHFIFNTLHAISTLMNRDVTGARRMIVRLSELLRVTMEQIDVQEIPLKDELGFINNYLEIEQIRFGDRLTVQMNVEPQVFDALVPAFLLQPLVENAVRHGIATQSQPGHIVISAKQVGQALQINIEDNGPGIRDIDEIKEGIGIANTRARLRELYPSAHALEFVSRKEPGTRLFIKLPLHTEPLWQQEEKDSAEHERQRA